MRLLLAGAAPRSLPASAATCVRSAQPPSALRTHAQELGKHNAWVSETIFWCLFIPFILWSFSPFVTSRKRFYTAVTYARLLMVLVGWWWACRRAGPAY